jgi:ribulose-5-phosphate 4-epimerase/fuculose-1-phosphate aldolase
MISGMSEGVFSVWIVGFATTILALKNPVGSEESAAGVSETLNSRPCVLLRGHGIFANGRNLEDAFRIVYVAESICWIVYLKTLLGGDEKNNHDDNAL